MEENNNVYTIKMEMEIILLVNTIFQVVLCCWAGVGSYGGSSQRPSGQWRSVGFSPLQSHQPLAELLMHP